MIKTDNDVFKGYWKSLSDGDRILRTQCADTAFHFPIRLSLMYFRIMKLSYVDFLLELISICQVDTLTSPETNISKLKPNYFSLNSQINCEFNSWSPNRLDNGRATWVPMIRPIFISDLIL